MTDRDLTPAEARAEVEAFMGEGWTVVHESWPRAYRMSARRGVRIEVESGYAPTTRAAVAALKQAWRDAVRPIMTAACHQYETHREEHTPEEVVARVLGEDK